MSLDAAECPRGMTPVENHGPKVVTGQKCDAMPSLTFFCASQIVSI